MSDCIFNFQDIFRTQVSLNKISMLLKSLYYTTVETGDIPEGGPAEGGWVYALYLSIIYERLSWLDDSKSVICDPALHPLGWTSWKTVALYSASLHYILESRPAGKEWVSTLYPYILESKLAGGEWVHIL